MPKSTKIILWILLLWNIMGLFSFYYHAFIYPEAVKDLSEAEQALAAQYPLWTTVVFALATLGGTIGNVGMLMGKAWSKPVLLVSLVAIIIQMTHSLGFTDSLDVYGTDAVYMPIMVILLAFYLFVQANKGIREGWLK